MTILMLINDAIIDANDGELKNNFHNDVYDVREDEAYINEMIMTGMT